MWAVVVVVIPSLLLPDCAADLCGFSQALPALRLRSRRRWLDLFHELEADAARGFDEGDAARPE